MALSITSDYFADTGDPQPYLRRIAEAGFSHIHWCHEWYTDYRYEDTEVEGLARLLKELELEVLDLHGTTGRTGTWWSGDGDERRAGVELVKNRLAMAASLGADVVVMHAGGPELSDAVLKSLDDVEPVARDLGVRIAIENGYFDVVDELLRRYPSSYLGLCYDSGHGNLVTDALERLDAIKDRLICVHLHDNDGTADQHMLPFSGTVDWERLTDIMARSGYSKCVSLEVSMRRSGLADENEFLAKAFECGTRLTGMIEKSRS